MTTDKYIGLASFILDIGNNFKKVVGLLLLLKCNGSRYRCQNTRLKSQPYLDEMIYSSFTAQFVQVVNIETTYLRQFDSFCCRNTEDWRACLLNRKMCKCPNTFLRHCNLSIFQKIPIYIFVIYSYKHFFLLSGKKKEKLYTNTK